MRHLLDDLLDLSRSDSGQLRLNSEAVEMAMAVREAVDLARSSLEREVELQLWLLRLKTKEPLLFPLLLLCAMSLTH